MAKSDKWYKRKAHKKERKLVNNQLSLVSNLVIPDKLFTYNPKKFGNIWNSQKDGKQYFGDMKYKEDRQWYICGLSLTSEYKELYKELMRK